MVAVGNTLLYTFFGVLQVIINQLIGVKGNLRKFLTPKGVAGISQITYYVFIPVYSFIELARLSTLDKIRAYWIIFICTFISVGIRTVSLYFLTKFLNFDKKVINAFTVIVSLPSLGSINLVLGKALCYEGCPLEGDDRCTDILGLMLVLMLVTNIYLYCVDFSLLILNENDYKFIKEKLSYIWYRVLTVLKKEDDYYVRYLFTKYIKNESKAISLYKKFILENRLMVDNQYKYIITCSKNIKVGISVEGQEIKSIDNKDEALDNSKKQEIENKNIYKQNAENDISNNEQLKNDKNQDEINIEKNENENNLNKEDKNDLKTNELDIDQYHFRSTNNLYFQNTKFENEVLHKKNDSQNYENNIKIAKNNELVNVNNVNNKDVNTMHITDKTNLPINNNKDGIFVNTVREGFIKEKENKEANKILQNGNSVSYTFTESFASFNIELDLKTALENNKILFFYKKKTIQPSDHVKDKMHEKEKESDNIITNKSKLKYIVKPKRKVSFEKLRSKTTEKDIDPFQKDKMEIKFYFDEALNQINKYLDSEIVEIEKQIGDQACLPVSSKNNLSNDNQNCKENIKEDEQNENDEIIDENHTKLNELNNYKDELKKEIDQLLSGIMETHLPKFKVIDSLLFSNSELIKFEETWLEFESKMLSLHQPVSLNAQISHITPKLLLKFILTPPMIACIVGIFFGISGLRNYIFTHNHYLNNVYLTIFMYTRAFVPLLFTNAGNSLMNAPKFNLNFALTKFYVYFSMFYCYILLPFIGMGYVALWRVMYGGIIAESKVVRFCLFIPWSVPSTAATYSILLNLLNKFYFEEYSYLLSRHTIALIFTQTYSLLLYFIIVG